MPETPNKVGRPTAYRPDFCVKIIQLVPLGCTTKQIATFLNVSESSVEKWKEDYPEFSQAINLAKLQADMDVAYSLHRNATRHNNFQAQAWWLKNRRPEEWSDKQSLDLRTPEGIQISVEEKTAAIRAGLDMLPAPERAEAVDLFARASALGIHLIQLGKKKSD